MNKILILASNPKGDLKLDREIRDLTDALERNIKQREQERYEVVFKTAVRPSDLLTLLREHKPRIVHFCGHGTGERGLLFQDEDDKGREQLVGTEALAKLFNHFAQYIQCSVFNACTSYVQAEAVVKYIDYGIGMSEEILDRAAYIFAVGFYQALADGESIEQAYEFGCIAVQVQLESLKGKTSRSSGSSKIREFEVIDSQMPVNPEHLKPKLYKKSTPSFASGNNLEHDLEHDLENELENELKSSTTAKVSPDFVKAIAQEIERKEYKDETRDSWDRFGQVSPGDIVQPSNQKQYRQRKTVLNKVKDFWIEGFLKPSLYADEAINLELKKRPDAVSRPFPGIEEFVELDESFEELKQTDIYNQIGQGKTLLILGEPGSGKTIALLQLAQRLVERTEQDLSQPIPVVFNLSSWANKQESIEEWLIEELKEKYQVPKQLSEPWMKEGQIILLLDGLDEVQAKYRNDCVRALNNFIITHGMTEMVVCSRVKDYEALTERLQLSSAICIQPISPKQLYEFLENVGDSLVGLKTLLQRDTELEKFARTPLILNIMSVTYQEWSAEELLQEFRSPDNHYQNLFDAYIKRMLVRRGNTAKYPKKKVKKWLGWLAKQMVNESQTVFLIEKMQPSCLEYEFAIFDYKSANFMIFGVIFGMIFGMIFGVIFGMIFGMIFGVIFGMIFGMIFGLSKKIILFEQISWSWERVNIMLIYLSMIGLPLCLVIFGLLSIGGNIKSGVLILGMSFLLIISLIIKGLSSGISLTEVEKRTIPNQGIKSSAKNFAIVVLFSGVIFGLIFELTFGAINSSLLVEPIEVEPILGLILGVIVGIIVGLSYGGAACIQHFNLRAILYTKGRIPWNYACFLDYATERILMKKVGGGYMFYHRMLLEHFAGIKQVDVPANLVPIAQTAIPVLNNLTCNNCGHENPTENTFCNNCGTRL